MYLKLKFDNVLKLIIMSRHKSYTLSNTDDVLPLDKVNDMLEEEVVDLSAKDKRKCNIVISNLEDHERVSKVNDDSRIKYLVHGVLQDSDIVSNRYEIVYARAYKS